MKLGVERYNLIRDEKEKLSELKSQEAKLIAELDWYTSIDFIESQSRDYLNLAEEGDSVLVIPEDVITEETFSTESQDHEEQGPDIYNWINLVFR